MEVEVFEGSVGTGATEHPLVILRLRIPKSSAVILWMNLFVEI